MPILTRKELYDMVWSKPLVQLAEEFGLSDVAVAKICKKHHIPRPPRGYWAKVAHGYMVTKVPLPRVGKKKDVKIRIEPSNCAGSAEITIPGGVEMLKAIGRLENRRDLFTDDILKHHLIEQTRSYYKNASVTESGYLSPKGKYHLSISATKTTLERALVAMARIIQIVERLGGNASIRKDPNVATCVDLLGETLKISVWEKIRQERIEKERRPGKRTGHDWYDFISVVEYHPTGRLTLSINQLEWTGLSQNWSDTKLQNAEARVLQFATGLVKAANHLYNKRLEAERRELQKEQEALRRREEYERWSELQPKIKAEREKVEALLAEANCWKQSQDLRAFIEATVAARHERSGQAVSEDEFEKWVQWAEDQADRLDPLKVSPTSILDEDRPEPRRW